MNLINVFVTLKIPDNTARSALYTIQHRMGYPALHSLRRSEFWQLSFSSLSESEAQNTVEQLVDKTAYFVNPNKHRWVVEPQPNGTPKQVIRSPFPSNASILVCDKIDGKAESTRTAIQELLDSKNHPESVKRGWWWDLDFQNTQPSDITKAVESLAVSKSRMEGFFANPHYQTTELYFPDE